MTGRQRLKMSLFFSAPRHQILSRMMALPGQRLAHTWQMLQNWWMP